jgi:hypothetical protein
MLVDFVSAPPANELRANRDKSLQDSRNLKIVLKRLSPLARNSFAGGIRAESMNLQEIYLAANLRTRPELTVGIIAYAS